MADSMWCSLAFERFAYADVCRCASVSKRWHSAASDPDLWMALCQQHFERHYVPESIKVKLGSASTQPAAVFKEAVLDLARVELTAEEFHSFTWNFRFKEMAGLAWTSQDPWWNDASPVQVRFHPGGRVDRQPEKPSGVELKWRWGSSPSTEPGSGNPPASSVRCNVNGRDVPTYKLGRHPVHGGFLMHSCWALYTAFRMPAKGEDPDLTDAALNLSAGEQIDEVRDYNLGTRPGLLRDDDGHIQLPVELAEFLQSQPRTQQLQILRALFAASSNPSDPEAESDDSDASSSDADPPPRGSGGYS